MTFRLGQVLWWLGLIWVVPFLAAAALVSITRPVDWLSIGVTAVILGLIVWGPLWAVSYILAGSFWSPPRRQA